MYRYIQSFIDQTRERASFAAVYAFVIRCASAGIAFVVQIVLARLLGVTEYGIFASVWIFVTICGHLLPLGFAQSATRFLAEYTEGNVPEKAIGFLKFSRVIVFASSITLTIGLAGLLYGAPDFFSRDFTAPLLLGAICLPFFALQDLFEGQARSHGWTGLSLVPIYVGRQLLFLGALIGALIAGYDPSAQTAMAAFLGALVISMLVQGTWIAIRMREHIPPTDPEYSRKFWIKTSLPMFLSDSLSLILTYSDILILTLFLEPKWVAIYFAVTRIGTLLGFVMFAVSAVTARKFAALMVRQDREAVHRFARTTVTLAFWPTLLGFFVLCAIGWPLLGVFGNEFDVGYGALVLLSLGYLIRSAVGGAEDLLVMTGHERIRFYIQSIAACANILANIMLIPVFGIEGAAFATTVSISLYSLLLNRSVIKHYDINLLGCVVPFRLRDKQV